MNRILDAYKAVHATDFATRFYCDDPLKEWNEPLGIADAIGQLSRFHFSEAKRHYLLPNIVLSRLLLGYKQAPEPALSYDQFSLINRYGDSLEDANRALRAILSYVQLSEKLSDAGHEPVAQLTRHIFQEGNYDKLFVVTSDATMFQDSKLQCQHLETDLIPHVTLAKEAFHITNAALDGSGFAFNADVLSVNDYGLLINHEKCKVAVSEWAAQNAASIALWKAFEGLKSRSILMLACLEQLGSDWAFVAVPRLFHKAISFYGWAGLWALIRLPTPSTDQIEFRQQLQQFHNQLHCLTFVAQELLTQIHGYGDRLEKWQRKILAEDREIYESLVAKEFLPRALHCELPPQRPSIQHSAWKHPLTFGTFLPQIPLLGKDQHVAFLLRPFLNVHRSAAISQERQAFDGAIHELQVQKINDASQTNSGMTALRNALRERLDWISPTLLNYDMQTDDSQDARQKVLESLRDELEIQRDKTEYLRLTVARKIAKWNISDKAKEKNLKCGFSYTRRQDILDWSWATLAQALRKKGGISELPFPIRYLERTLDALWHNCEKHSTTGERCELLCIEKSDELLVQWSVYSLTPIFASYSDFQDKVITPLLGDDPKGIHRGIPLALMFGLETMATQIGVWLKCADGACGWNSIGCEKCDNTKPDCSLAVRWVWKLNSQVPTA